MSRDNQTARVALAEGVNPLNRCDYERSNSDTFRKGWRLILCV